MHTHTCSQGSQHATNCFMYSPWCPCLLGDSLCQQTTSPPTDPLPRPLDPVLVFSPLSQPSSNRGHPPMETKSPLVPSMCVHSQHAIERPQCPTPHICTHTHIHTYTMPITIPSFSALHSGNIAKAPISVGCPGHRAVSGLSSSSASPKAAPCLAPPPAWYRVVLFPEWGGQAGGRSRGG